MAVRADLRERLYWIGLYRLAHMSTERSREALRVHGVDAEAITQIGDTLITVQDVLNEMPGQAKKDAAMRTRVGKVLAAFCKAPLDKVNARDFASRVRVDDLRRVSVELPTKRRRANAKPATLGKKAVTAISEIFERHGLPLSEAQTTLFGDAHAGASFELPRTTFDGWLGAVNAAARAVPRSGDAMTLTQFLGRVERAIG